MNVFDLMGDTSPDTKMRSICPHRVDRLSEGRPSPEGAPANKTNRCGTPVMIPREYIDTAERAAKNTLVVTCPGCGKRRLIATRRHKGSK